MTFDWRTIVAAVLAALAAQGGWIGAIAALIAQYILPLIGAGEKLQMVEAAKATADSGAPDEFKRAVREYFVSLANKINRPLIRALVRNIVANLSDTILDTAYRIITGGENAPTAASMPAAMKAEGEAPDLTAFALDEVHAAAKENNVTLK